METNQSVAETVFGVIARKVDRPDVVIDSDTSLEALGIDSLDMTEIVFDLEETFDIQIPDTADISDRFRSLTTAGSAVELVRALLQRKGQG